MRETQGQVAMCPQCGSENITIAPYDFGVCPRTGYRDCGVRVTCLDCGAVADAGEVELAMEKR